MESRWEKASQFPHPPSTVVFADFATEFAICSVVTYYRCAAVVVDDKSITDVRSITTQKRRFKVVKPHFRIVRISVQHIYLDKGEKLSQLPSEPVVIKGMSRLVVAST